MSKAARTGQWDDALEAHVAACPACGEVALVSNGLRAMALDTDDHKPLPDPYLVWLKAKLTERQAASQRASKPWDLAEALGLVGRPRLDPSERDLTSVTVHRPSGLTVRAKKTKTPGKQRSQQSPAGAWQRKQSIV